MQRPRARRRLLALLLLISLLGAGGCLTPHVGLGVGVGLEDGHLKVRPQANVGFYGHL